jgi:hypothetical protein
MDSTISTVGDRPMLPGMIDFAVGLGSNDYQHDSTSIDAAVCPAS